MNHLTHHKIKTDGLLQHYISAGEGPVVLCLRGWPQTSANFFQ